MFDEYVRLLARVFAHQHDGELLWSRQVQHAEAALQNYRSSVTTNLEKMLVWISHKDTYSHRHDGEVFRPRQVRHAKAVVDDGVTARAHVPVLQSKRQTAIENG